VFDDFQFLQGCDHFVISNSSLSWWAARLSSARGHTVVAPYPWFSSAWYTPDLLFENWLQLNRKTGRTMEQDESGAVNSTVCVVIPTRQRASLLPSAVLHVGAHEAEEADDYKKHNWGHVIWVEMLPEKYAALRCRFSNDTNATVLNAACWDEDGVKLPIFRASNGQSSSLLRPEYHLTAHPSISFAEDAEISTSRLDTILPSYAQFDFVNFDIQGAELRALRGLGARIAGVKWAYLEVNTRRLYQDCALAGEIDVFMKEAGFSKVATRIARPYG
jgi:FkbM family methyltransferase